MTYYRFGMIPPSGRSQNFIKGGYERGVSVFPSTPDDITPATWECIISRIGKGETLYEVCGDVVGVGESGEPLLSNCVAERCSLSPVVQMVEQYLADNYVRITQFSRNDVIACNVEASRVVYGGFVYKRRVTL